MQRSFRCSAFGGCSSALRRMSGWRTTSAKLTPSLHNSSSILSTRHFSVTKLTSDNFSLINTGNGKEIYLVGTSHIIGYSARQITEIVSTVKPDQIFLQVCESRGRVLENLYGDFKEAIDKGELTSTMEEQVQNASLKWYQSTYPNSFYILERSTAVIKPVELFGIMFGAEHLSVMHVRNQLISTNNDKKCELTFGDNDFKSSMNKFENMAARLGDIQKDAKDSEDSLKSDMMRAAMSFPGGFSDKDLKDKEKCKRFMEHLKRTGFYGMNWEDEMKEQTKQNVNPHSKGDTQNAQAGTELKKLIGKRTDKKITELDVSKRQGKNHQYKIEELEEMVIEQGIEVSKIRTREAARAIVAETKSFSKDIYTVLYQGRSQAMCESLKKSPHQRILALVGFAFMDSIEEYFA